MKKIKFILIISLIFLTTGCFNDVNYESMTITTSVYPVEYIVNKLYGEYGSITSIYPKNTEANDYEITDVLLEDYKDNDMFIFNGLSNEKNYVKSLIKYNEELKIIDVTSNMTIDYTQNELWLDPNNLLTIANNIKEGFNEYIDQTVLNEKINQNYENLKLELTTLDSKYYNAIKKSSNSTIIISDNSFMYLEKYGINIISIDEKTVTAKDIADAINAINSGECNYIFVPYESDNTDTLDDVLSKAKATKLELYTMTNLVDIDTTKIDYIALSNQNLSQLKKELYK